MSVFSLRRAGLAAVVLVGVGAGSCRPPAAWAQDSSGASPGRAWYQDISLNGFVSAGYSFNSNRPASRTNQFRVFDFSDATFKLDGIELVAQKGAAKPREAGFRFDLSAGGSIPRVAASAGLFRDVDGKAGDIDLQQAFVSYVLPVGSGIKLDFGKFITSQGYEVIEGYDGWNDNASRSLLFGFAIPFTHTGVRAGSVFSPEISGQLMVVNGWDNSTDNNRAKTVGAQVLFTPASEWTVCLTGLAGNEQPDSFTAGARTGIDVVAVWKAGSALTLGLNADYDAERDFLGPGRDAVWGGLAGYARATLSPKVALIARGEYFRDRDGVRTGAVQNLSEFTLTPEFRPAPGFALRVDLRIDHSNHEVFESKDGPKSHQFTVLGNALFTF